MASGGEEPNVVGARSNVDAKGANCVGLVGVGAVVDVVVDWAEVLDIIDTSGVKSGAFI